MVLGSSFGIFYILLFKLYNNQINLLEVIIPMISLISSFDPVIALSNLSLGLSPTLASGRILRELLDEEPTVTEVKSNNSIKDENLLNNDISFSYKINKKTEIEKIGSFK